LIGPDRFATMSVAAVVDSSSATDGVMPLQIYFCASIRGEEVSKSFLNKLITHLKQTHGQVLTEVSGHAKRNEA
jgi:hypothetical protein